MKEVIQIVCLVSAWYLALISTAASNKEGKAHAVTSVCMLVIAATLEVL